VCFVYFHKTCNIFLSLCVFNSVCWEMMRKYSHIFRGSCCADYLYLHVSLIPNYFFGHWKPASILDISPYLPTQQHNPSFEKLFKCLYLWTSWFSGAWRTSKFKENKYGPIVVIWKERNSLHSPSWQTRSELVSFLEFWCLVRWYSKVVLF